MSSSNKEGGAERGAVGVFSGRGTILTCSDGWGWCRKGCCGGFLGSGDTFCEEHVVKSHQLWILRVILVVTANAQDWNRGVGGSGERNYRKFNKADGQRIMVWNCMKSTRSYLGQKTFSHELRSQERKSEKVSKPMSTAECANEVSKAGQANEWAVWVSGESERMSRRTNGPVQYTPIS